MRTSRLCLVRTEIGTFLHSLVLLKTLLGERQRIAHKGVRAIDARNLQKPVFARPSCQRMSVNTLLCDTFPFLEQPRQQPSDLSLVARAIRNVIRANRFARIIRNRNPAHQADSHESLEFPIRANHATKDLSIRNSKRLFGGYSRAQLREDPGRDLAVEKLQCSRL